MKKRSAARQRGVLIPVLFDNVSVPLGFASVQAAKLIGWDGATTSTLSSNCAPLLKVDWDHRQSQDNDIKLRNNGNAAKEELDWKVEEQKRRRQAERS